LENIIEIIIPKIEKAESFILKHTPMDKEDLEKSNPEWASEMKKNPEDKV
jgi:hypothetical protein